MRFDKPNLLMRWDQRFANPVKALWQLSSTNRTFYVRQRRRDGFTLLELVAAMAILAVLSGLTAMSLRSHIHHAMVQRAIECIRDADGHARSLARSRRQVSVSLGILDDRLEVQRANSSAFSIGQAGKGPRSDLSMAIDRRFSIGRSCRIELISPLGGAGRGGRVYFSTSGLCESYVVRIARGRDQLWLCILGMSGQAVRCESEDEARELLAYAQ